MIGCIIQARMGSTRLPGKVLIKIMNKPVLAYLINQLKFSKTIEDIVIATTTDTEDDIIEKFAKTNKIKIFRGNEKNVLDRYYHCAKKFNFNSIIRITSDCPLIDPNILDNIVKIFQKDKYDYVSNAIHRSYPFGTEVEVFSFKELENTWRNAQSEIDKEHVTPYMRRNSKNIKNVELKTNLTYLRWTLDFPEDLEMIKEIISEIKKEPILLEDILELVKRKPNILKINEKIKIDKKYLEDLSESID